jgi:hypothetical protein
LPFNFSVVASEFEFAIALGEDLDTTAGEPIGWSSMADWRVQPNCIVMVDEALDDSKHVGTFLLLLSLLVSWMAVHVSR